MSRSKGEAFKNLKLDQAFFDKMMRKGAAITEGTAEDGAQDCDLYLMEKSVLPVLLQGLDALSRHVDKLGSGGGLIGGGRAPFNPLTWLAQYLLRNHPNKVRDHRTPLYLQLGDMAGVERGRRGLLRRRPEMADEWVALEAGSSLSVEDIPAYVQRLDDTWNLDGNFRQKLPADFHGVVRSPDGGPQITFSDFWDWFEPFVRQSDLVRTAALDAALAKKARAEELARRAAEERPRHQEKVQALLAVRRRLTEEFESISADMYTNEIVGQILNSSFSIQGVQEQEGGPPLRGDHIELVVAMLNVWGFEASPPPGDVWNGAALAAWQQWMEAYGPKGVAPRMDATTLRQLMDRDQFQAFFLNAHPAPAFDIGTQAHGSVEIRGLLDGDGLNGLADAVDEDTGQARQLVLPEPFVGLVRQRLADPSGEPVLCHADFVTQRITDVLPQEA